MYNRIMTATSKRTTVTLPAAALERAEEIAAERHMTLSAVISEMLEDGLAMLLRARRADQILAAYRTAFQGFTEEERLLLDGVELEPMVD